MLYRFTVAVLLVLKGYFPLAQNAPQIFRFQSTHTAFPDSARLEGYVYDSILYTASDHYSDNSVMAIVSGNFRNEKKIDLVFWFHGWHNNIDTALEFYDLKKQFIQCNRKAIFVLAETAKNAPDSYGGKLEKPGMFKALVDDLIRELKAKGVLDRNAAVGNIVLAGHSGAFRVIAYTLESGGANVHEVLLFDALYSQVDKYIGWIQSNPKNHFIHWFTNKGGGTDEMSYQMMDQLKKNGLQFNLLEENQIGTQTLKTNRILFIHSDREHNVIINHPDDLKLLLENSFVLKQRL